MTERKRKSPFRWTQEQHEKAVEMWSEGYTTKHIADVLGLTPRIVGHHVEIYRDKFPRRRSTRRPGVRQKRTTVEMCATEYDLLAAASKRAGVSITTMVRNAILLSKQKGYPVIDPEAMLGETIDLPAPKAKYPFKDRTGKPQKPVKKLIPYAGA